MIPILSRAQMRAFDAHAIERCRVPSLLLMENAGRGAADVVEREVLGGKAAGKRVVVVCGVGNNGGDGFVVARHLLARGAHVSAWLAGDTAKMSADCKANHAAFGGIGGTIEAVAPGASLDALGRAVVEADVVVDALFGTGLDRPIAEPMASVIGAIRLGAAAVCALDLPSGLDADTGVTLGVAVDADLTVTFAHLKLGLATPHGASLAGTVHVVDIGVPSALLAERSAELVEVADVALRMGGRAVDAHKYSAGHVAIVAGSPGKVGAALLAARGALRGGAGAASVLTWSAAMPALEGRMPEVMVTALASPDDPAALRSSVYAGLAHKRAVVVGPGFGIGSSARAVVEHILSAHTGAIVADADVFSLYAGAPEGLAAASGRLVLTPHSGELARLLGTTAEAVENDRIGAAKEGAKRSGGVLLLKGAYTVIADPGGRVVISGSGVPALATAGSGDVLAGLIGALVCALPPFEAAWCGAFLHGVSGSAWQKEHGDRGLLAGEIADGLPGVLASIHTAELDPRLDPRVG